MSTQAIHHSPIQGASINKSSAISTEILIGTLLALFSNWEEAEARTGRRGTYLTTGAQSFRARAIPPELVDSIMQISTTFGMDLTQEAIEHAFSGEFEYQISFSVNKFQTRKPSQAGLSLVERRAVEKVRSLLSEDEKRAKLLELLAG